MADESQVRTWLTAVSPSPVDDRVYLDVVPPTLPKPLTLPYIVYSVVSDTPENHITDAPEVSNLRVQLDIYVAGPTDFAAIRSAVRAALNSRGKELLCIGGFDDDTRLHRYTMDWSFWLAR